MEEEDPHWQAAEGSQAHRVSCLVLAPARLLWRDTLPQLLLNEAGGAADPTLGSHPLRRRNRQPEQGPDGSWKAAMGTAGGGRGSPAQPCNFFSVGFSRQLHPPS